MVNKTFCNLYISLQISYIHNSFAGIKSIVLSQILFSYIYNILSRLISLGKLEFFRRNKM